MKTGTQGTVVNFTGARSDLCRWQYNYGITPAMAAEDWPRITSRGQWPVVEWIDSTKPVDAPDRIMSMLPVYPYRCTLEDGSGEEICSRMQLPLLLAYGLTVHRAQGMTLDSVVFDTEKIWCFGQLYTALSRVRDFSRLRLLGGVSRDFACCHADVVRFERESAWVGVDNREEIGGVE